MIKHIVLIKFNETLGDEAIQSIFTELHQINGKVSGLLSIAAGRSESPEQIERGYMHGFVVDFTDWKALAAYQEHPDHKALGAKLVANAVDGLDGILVFDLPVSDR